MTVVVLTFGLLLSGVVTALLVPVACRLAIEYGWVDKPDDIRKQHERATPNIGGVAIVAGTATGVAYLGGMYQFHGIGLSFPLAAVWAGAAIMVFTGLYDDIRGLSFKGKFFMQTAVAYLLVCAGYGIDLTRLPFVSADPYQQAVYSVPLTLLWIVGVINAVNLLDGLDGLAAGESAPDIASLAMIFGARGEVALAIAAVPIIGALVGFLWHNFNPASIFMGDSGSLFLGFLLALYSLQGQAHSDGVLAIVVPVIALGLPIIDTGMSIVRRVTKRQAICAPDADHIHHRLVRRYSSVPRAVLILYAIAATFGTTAILIAVSAPMFAYGVVAGVVLVIPLGLRQLGYTPLRDLTRSISEHTVTKSVSNPTQVNGSSQTALHNEGDGEDVVMIPSPGENDRPPGFSDDGGIEEFVVSVKGPHGYTKETSHQ